MSGAVVTKAERAMILNAWDGAVACHRVGWDKAASASLAAMFVVLGVDLGAPHLIAYGGQR